MVWNNSPISGFAEEGDLVKVTVGKGNDEKQLSCNKLAICTNAFTKSYLPGLDINPGRGQVLVTKLIENLPFKGTFHFDEGFYYFRNYENRVIFGGGRNLDFEGESTLSMGTTEQIKADLTEKLTNMILPNQKVEIDYWWSGIMAFGPNKQPIVQKHSPNIALGVRLGGMGVAIGTHIGAEVASLLSQQ